MILYSIEYFESVLKKDVPKLNNNIKVIIKNAIEHRLKTNPLEFGKPLRYSLVGHRSLRDGDYRVLYRIDPTENKVIIVSIKHRKDVYNER